MNDTRVIFYRSATSPALFTLFKERSLAFFLKTANNFLSEAGSLFLLVYPHSIRQQNSSLSGLQDRLKSSATWSLTSGAREFTKLVARKSQVILTTSFFKLSASRIQSSGLDLHFLKDVILLFFFSFSFMTPVLLHHDTSFTASTTFKPSFTTKER